MIVEELPPLPPLDCACQGAILRASVRRHRSRSIRGCIGRSNRSAQHDPSGRLSVPFRPLRSATEAYVILHEVAHFLLASTERRRLVDFGLGPGPDTRNREAAEHAAVISPLAREEDEAAASLLGIIWEAKLGQPALASFLDQNWLEGLDRSAHTHFVVALGKLRRSGSLDLTLSGVPGMAKLGCERRAAAARTL